MRCTGARLTASLALTALWVAGAPAASADNTRLNNGVAASVYTVRYQAGCASPISG